MTIFKYKGVYSQEGADQLFPESPRGRLRSNGLNSKKTDLEIWVRYYKAHFTFQSG